MTLPTVNYQFSNYILKLFFIEFLVLNKSFLTKLLITDYHWKQFKYLELCLIKEELFIVYVITYTIVFYKI